MTHKGLAKAQGCHRVALAVEDFDGAMSLWRDVFGLGSMVASTSDGQDQSQMGIVWAGNMPLLALSSTDSGGTVGRYLARNGPSVQSLAWEVDDMWATDARLRQAGITITGVHVEGRHFFMHPKDTSGLLLEFTDDILPLDPRHGDEAPEPAQGVIPVRSVAWVTAAVENLEAVMEQFELIFGEPIEAVATPESAHEQMAQVQLGDLLVRLAQPSSDESRYAGLAHNGMGRLHSVALAVEDFAEIETRVADAGLRIESRTEDSVWIDPDAVQGIRYQLVGTD
jgi:catechol 2,3-dioxygenase-like lactoylglutathione lyase family enzyme